MALKVVPSTLSPTTHWGRHWHTAARILSAVELLNAARKQHQEDSPARADELGVISERLLEMAEAVRADLERKQRG